MIASTRCIHRPVEKRLPLARALARGIATDPAVHWISFSAARPTASSAPHLVRLLRDFFLWFGALALARLSRGFRYRFSPLGARAPSAAKEDGYSAADSGACIRLSRRSAPTVTSKARTALRYLEMVRDKISCHFQSQNRIYTRHPTRST